MSVSGIQGQLLEVTVVACNNLKDTEWVSRQDPYVVLQYGTTKLRTRTCKDGGKNPKFQEKFVFTLIEGLTELSVVVWNSNSITKDDFIGAGKVQLEKVLSQGYDDCSWTLQMKNGRYAGEIRLTLHYASTNKPASTHSSSAPPLYPAQPPQLSISGYPSPATSCAAPPSYPPSYPPGTLVYPPPAPAPYPPTSAYPPAESPYPPPSVYPPPPPGSSHYPPGSCPGAYPPPPPPPY